MKSTTDESKKIRRKAEMLFAFFLAFYWTQGENRIFSWHPGSHYALIQSLGDRGTLWVNGYHEQAGRDLSLGKDGRLYSSKGPGFPFLALPFYVFAKATGKAMNLKQSALEEWKILWVRLVPAAAGAAAAVCFFYLLWELGLSNRAAVFGAVSFALGSSCGKYAPQLFVHTLSAFFSLLSLYSYLQLRKGRFLWAVVFGFCWSAAVTVEISNVFLGIVWLALLPGISSHLEAKKNFFVSLLAAVLGLLPLAVYQTIAFGAPWWTSYHFPLFPQESGPGNLQGFHWENLERLFFSTTNEPRVGLFAASPLAFGFLFGVFRLWQKRRKTECFVVIAVITAHLALVGTFRNFFGGGTNDIRYLTVAQTFLLLLAWLGWGWFLSFRDAWIRRLAGMLFGMTSLWSFLLYRYFAAPHAANVFYNDFFVDVFQQGKWRMLFQEREGIEWNVFVFAAVLLVYGVYAWRSSRPAFKKKED